jgi:L-ribulose-5-phosphate 4-epimerase
MITPEFRELVYRANLQLAESGLVTGTFGNVSAVDRDLGIVVIKPSGVAYDQLTPGHMVPVSLETGAVLEGTLRPSSDTPTHLELYRSFECGGIVHTHSEFATVFAQARRPIPCLGTTHADYFRGEVPVTRCLRVDEVEGDYERNTGAVIGQTFRDLGVSELDVPAILVANHAPFTWGADAFEAIARAEMLEFVARLAWRTRLLSTGAAAADACLVDRHHRRKHGPSAYYGQK